MASVKLLCTYRCNFLLVILSVAVSLIVLTFLYHPQIKEFQLPIYDSYLNYYLQDTSAGTQLDNDYSFNSTCSRAADERGPNQRVIAYSLYGDFSREDVFHKYLSPLKRTISLIPLIYPGWIVRIYLNQTSGKDLKIFSEDHVDLCNATEIVRMKNLGDLFAMTWRWLPLLDDMVDTLMSRDSDSAITSREKEAVSDWLASNKSFHIMRDHPAHCFFGFIMGCCWGVKVSQDRPRIVLAAEKMFDTNHSHTYDYDQILLDKLIWPIAGNNSIAHDSYCCEVFRNTQPFPKQRNDRTFVGSRSLSPEFITEELSDLDECPQQCRPLTYVTSEWNFC